jgi:hypothetical protein
VPDASDEEDAEFLQSFGYKVSRPFGTDDHLRVTWRFPFETSEYTPQAEYTECPIAVGAGLLLVDETFDDDPNRPNHGFVTRVYDDLPGPELISSQELREQGIPSRFIRKQNITKTTQPVKNDATLGSTGGDPTSEQATVETNLSPAGENKVIFRKGDTKLEVEVEAVSGWTFDEHTGIMLPVTQELVPAGTAGVDINAAGVYSEVSPINPFWSVKTTRKATGLVDEIVYDSVKSYPWPAVLESIEFFTVEAKGDSGNYVSKYGYHFELKEAYSGPCDAHITEGWSLTPPTAVATAAMQPKSITWDFVLFRGSIPRCLHPAFTITETVGSTHPTYVATVSTREVEATNYTEWPGSIVAAFDVWPGRGGFRYRKIVIDRPNVS